jgi:hypothetical protein
MARRYAEGTTTSVNVSRNEIETLVRKFGAYQILAYEDRDRAIVQFTAHDRRIRLTLSIPSDESLSKTETGRRRSVGSLAEARDKEMKRLWRALVLLVRAKITAVNEQIVTFEEEFLANVVMADGRTVAEHTKEPIALSYKNGNVQTLLPDFSKGT